MQGSHMDYVEMIGEEGRMCPSPRTIVSAQSPGVLAMLYESGWKVKRINEP